MGQDIKFYGGNKNNSGNKIVTGAVIAVVVVVGIWGLSRGFSKKTSETNLKSSVFEATETQSETQSVEQPIKVVIDYGDSQKTEAEVLSKEGLTAFLVLEEVTKGENIDMEITKYDFGVMVNSIGAYKGGDDGKYWMYYVNSKVPEVGADQYKVGAGDVVEWKFEKS